MYTKRNQTWCRSSWFLGTGIILILRTWTLLPLLQMQGAKHSISPLQLPHLAFNITLYLNILMNIKDKHFDGQWEYQNITCECLLDHIYCRTNTSWFSATAMPTAKWKYQMQRTESRDPAPTIPSSKPVFAQGFLQSPTEQKKTFPFVVSGLVPLASGQCCYKHTRPKKRRLKTL